MLRGQLYFLGATLHIFSRWRRVQILLFLRGTVHDVLQVFFDLWVCFLQAFTVARNRVRFLVLHHQLRAVIDRVLQLRHALLHVEAVDVWHHGLLLVLLHLV